MADQRHLNKLNEGVKAWNHWREEHQEILPDLRKTNIYGASLTGIDLRRTNLNCADLSNANLSEVRLNYSKFS